MKQEVNKKIEEHWDKMVADSKQVAGYNYDKYGEDLLMFTLSEFLNKKPIEYQYKVAVTDNKLPNYIGRAMSLQIRSSTSMFWRYYRKGAYNSRGVYEAEHVENEDLYDSDYLMSPDKEKSAYDCMMWVMKNELDWYEKVIIEEIYLNKTPKKVFREKYGLPNNSFNKDLKKTITKFRKLCSQFT